MSADKNRRRDRAYAFIRNLRHGGRGFPRGEAKTDVSGRLSSVMRYCLDRDLATMSRIRRPSYGSGVSNRRNIFNAD